MGSGERGDGPRGMRLTGKDDRAGPRRFFGARRHRFRHRHPSISWKPFALVATALAGLAGLLLDGPATLLARHQPDWLASFSVATTDIGKSGWLIGGSLFLSLGGLALARSKLSRRLRRRGWALHFSSLYLFTAIAGSGLASNLLKRIIGRARPTIFDETGPFTFSPLHGSWRYESFPSGHATTDGALFMGLALLFPRLRIPLLLIGLAAATTRISVGAHYPSDVIAGYLFGMWCALFAAILFARSGLVFRGGRPGLPAPTGPFNPDR